MTILELPWPPYCLTPNAKRHLHWRKYNEPAKAYRKFCWATAFNAKAKGRITKVTFYPPDRRHRDDDGMIGAFKHGRDGIADATKVDDRHYRPQYEFGEPVKGGKIVVTIEEEEQ